MFWASLVVTAIDAALVKSMTIHVAIPTKRRERRFCSAQELVTLFCDDDWSYAQVCLSAISTPLLHRLGQGSRHSSARRL